MVVGIVDHQTGTRDIRELPALGRGLARRSRRSTVVSCGVDGRRARWLGFVAKEAAYERLYEASFAAAGRVLVGGRRSARCSPSPTALRFAWGVLVAPRRAGRARRDGDHRARHLVRRAAACVLAAVTVVLGVAPGARRPDSSSAAVAVPRRRAPDPCTSRCGTASTSPSLLSRADAGRRASACSPADRVVSPRAWPWASGSRAAPTRTSPPCAGLNVVADRVTGVVQNGSLPVYAGVILAHRRRPAGGRAAASAPSWPGWPELVEHAGPGAGPGGRAGRRRSPRPAPATVLGGAVPRRRRLRHGGAVRRAGRARPRPHPGRDRDPVDGAVRAGAPPPARPLRARSRPPAGGCVRVAISASRWPARCSRFALVAGQQPAERRRSPTRWSSGPCPTGTAATSST